MVPQTYNFFYKIINGLAPKYLVNYLNINDNQVYKTRASEDNNIKRFGTRTGNFKQSFFPFCLNEWCKVDISLRRTKDIESFKSMFKDLFNLKQNSLFAIHDSFYCQVIKLLSRLRLKFNHLNGHKFCHNFKDALSPMYDCGSETETTHYFFLHYPFFAIKRQKILNDLLKIAPSLRNLKDELLLTLSYIVLTSIRTLLTRKCFFIQLVLSKIRSVSKDHYLTTNLLFYFYYIYFFSRKL